MGYMGLISLWLLPLLTASTSASSSGDRFAPSTATISRNLPSQHQHMLCSTNNALLFGLRGGSTKTPPNPDKYRMQQILLLQSRSERLREALTDRGLFQDYSAIDAPTTPQPVDWDCALSTEKNPKSCLYTFDAEPNTKVVAPVDTDQWISLESLVRLRRTDPSKVEPLWHNQFAIFDSWFKTGSKSSSSSSSSSGRKTKNQKAILQSSFSMYNHLPWQGHILALLLDFPLILNVVVMATIGFVLAVTRPVWESMLMLMLTSQFLWKRWPSWARFLHAAFPFKLLMGQMTWKALAEGFSKIKGIVRDHLIDMESRIWEECIPLTIVEARQEQRLQEDDEEYESELVAEEDGGEGDSVESEDESEE